MTRARSHHRRTVSDILERERVAWRQISDLVRGLSREEFLAPGYYRDSNWSARDLLSHLGTWLAEAQVQLERIHASSYEGHEIDIDAMNARFLDAMRDQPWEVVVVQAQAARTEMLRNWYAGPIDGEAIWWIRKSGAEHYAEHLPRLREWAAELVASRKELI